MTTVVLIINKGTSFVPGPIAVDEGIFDANPLIKKHRSQSGDISGSFKGSVIPCMQHVAENSSYNSCDKGSRRTSFIYGLGILELGSWTS